MSIRRVPFWLDRFPSSRRPSYAQLRSDCETDVVIVGGGLTGCACAWSFAAAGVKTVLLEADTIGGATTSRGTGVVREDFEASFQQTAALHGLRAARTLWQSMHRASLDLAAAARRLELPCDLGPQEVLAFAPPGAAAARPLRREYESRRAAGLDHRWVTPASLARETALESGGAIRTRGSSLDPYRACLGFAHAAADRGAVLHERTAVRRIRAGRKQVEVTTERGTILAQSVVVATAAPLPDLRALRRHLKSRHTYTVVTEPLPAAVRRETGRRAATLRGSESPSHTLRWLRDDRILFAGADQPEVSLRGRDKALTQRTGQLMYELSLLYPAISGLQPEWAWDALHYETVDHLPFVGLHRNFPRHLFALGADRHGPAVAWLAARLTLRQYQEAPTKGDDLFSFARVL
ncbi:MAG: FAD-binding oxidoreductase [Acidobacteriota bacterium]